jgi:hypothetical protein
VIVFDEDFVGIAVLPPERDAILIVHADAVPASVLAFQSLEPVAGRNHEVLEAPCRIQKQELTLNDAPDVARYPSRESRVPFAKEVGRRLVSE